MIYPRTFSLWLLGVSALAACADTSSNRGGTATPVTTAQQFETAFAETLCDQLFRCPIANDDTLLVRALLGTTAACVPLAASTLQPWSYLRPALAAGRVRYDPVAGERCLARLRAVCRTDGLDTDAIALWCPDVFVGSVASGGACHSSFECGPERYCQRDDTSTGPRSCPGTCRARIPLGGTCNFNARACAHPAEGWAECRSDGDAQPTCRAVTVGTPAGESQPCGYIPVAGRDATTMVPCQDGLWCSERVGEGTCRRPIPVGAPCTDDDQVCADNALCVSAGAGMPETCRVIPLRTRAGETCGQSVLALCSPAARLRCSSNRDGTCMSSGTGAMGAPCMRANPGEVVCDPGLVCRTTEAEGRTCRAPAAAGEECDNNPDCASGSCDSLAGRCAAQACE